MNDVSPITVTPISFERLDTEAFAPFGAFVNPPKDPGQRAYYSDRIGHGQSNGDMSLHVNHVMPSTLPLTIERVERHPYSAQAFLPLDLSRYLIVAMPSDTDGSPDIRRAAAWLLPPSIGVIYHANVWHAGATVFDRKGHFAVFMWRTRVGDDDEIREIERLTVLDSKRPADGLPAAREHHHHGG